MEQIYYIFFIAILGLSLVLLAIITCYVVLIFRSLKKEEIKIKTEAGTEIKTKTETETGTKIKCPTCSEEVEIGWKQCPVCSTILEDAPTKPIPTPEAEVPEPVPPPAVDLKCHNCGEDIEAGWIRCPVCKTVLKSALSKPISTLEAKPPESTPPPAVDLKCHNCGEDIETDWIRCPICSTTLTTIPEAKIDEKQEANDALYRAGDMIIKAMDAGKDVSKPKNKLSIANHYYLNGDYTKAKEYAENVIEKIELMKKE